MLDVAGVGGGLDGRDLVVERQVERLVAPRVDPHLARLAVQVARRQRPLLTLAAVHRQLDDVAVGAVEGLVAVEQRLHPVLAGGDVGQARQRIAVGAGVDRRLRPRRQRVDVDAEDLLGAGAVADLEARLGAAVGGDQQQQAAVERLRAALGGEADGEAERMRGGALPGAGGGGEGGGEEDEGRGEDGAVAAGRGRGGVGRHEASCGFTAGEVTRSGGVAGWAGGRRAWTGGPRPSAVPWRRGSRGVLGPGRPVRVRGSPSRRQSTAGLGPVDAGRGPSGVPASPQRRVWTGGPGPSAVPWRRGSRGVLGPGRPVRVRGSPIPPPIHRRPEPGDRRSGTPAGRGAAHGPAGPGRRRYPGGGVPAACSAQGGLRASAGALPAANPPPAWARWTRAGNHGGEWSRSSDRQTQVRCRALATEIG